MGEKSDNGTFKEGKDFSWVWLLLFLVLLLVVCIAYPFILRGLMHWMNPGRLDKYGLVGDMFGALNAFISGCAFCGVIFSLHQQKIQLELQREDLKLQRNDLALQREEMQKAREEAERQTEQFEKQVQIGKKTQFADDFFRRIELLRAMQSSIVHTEIPYNTPLIYHTEGSQVPKEVTGMLAWKTMHDTIQKSLIWNGDINDILVHTEALPAIIAWHASISALIKDTIEYFQPRWREYNAPDARGEEAHYIHILLHLLSVYQKDFLILLFDAMDDPEIQDVRRYLYNKGFLSKDNKTSNPFATDSDKRGKLLRELRREYSR